MWSALERRQYLKAAQLYLFSHHIVSILHIDTGDSSAPKLLVGYKYHPLAISFNVYFYNFIVTAWQLVTDWDNEIMQATDLWITATLNESKCDYNKCHWPEGS